MKCIRCGCEETAKNGREVYCVNCGAVLMLEENIINPIWENYKKYWDKIK